MDRFNRCSDEQRNRSGEERRRSTSELLDELAELVGKLPPERQAKLIEELESGELERQGDEDAEES